MNFNFLLNDELNKIVKQNIDNDIKIWIVGGTIRDFLLNKECFDTDYVISGMKAFDFAKIIADKVEGFFVPLDEQYDIARVVMPDKKTTLDFAAALEGDIYKDLQRRDFSINAMAFSLNTNEFIDLFNGVEDLKNGLIKLIAEKNITDDPLRILRAYRCAAQFGFNIEENTLSILKKHQHLINNVAIERVKAELIKFFEGDFSAENLFLMKENGFLFEIFPIMKDQLKVPSNLHHHLPLIDHSIETVRQTGLIIKTLPEWIKQHLSEEIVLGISRLALLKIAALLHDVGKPNTWEIDQDGRHRFIKHEEIGSEIVLPILKKMTFSKTSIKIIEKLIKFHLYPSQILKEETVTGKSELRFYRRIEKEVPELIIIAMADRLSARGPEISDEIVNKNINGLNWLLTRYNELSESAISIPKLLSGNEVMSILNVPRGVKVGIVIKALHEAQINGEVNDYEQAKTFVKMFNFTE
jgi:putative nucleotidyltransferase with HDIG domain